MKSLIFCLCLAFIMAFSGCDGETPANMNNLHDQASYFAGIVEEVFENSILVRVNEDDRGHIGASLAFVSTTAYLSDSMTEFMSGDEVIWAKLNWTYKRRIDYEFRSITTYVTR